MPARISRTFWASGAAARARAGRIEVPGRPRAVGGQEPLQLDGEEQDQHQPEPEARHRLEEERAEPARVVRAAALMGGRHDPERDGERGREQRWPRRPARRWRARNARGPCAMAGRFSRMEVPKSPRGTAPRKSRYWTSERAVEPELGPHRGHLLPGGGLVHEEDGGISGEADEEEDDGDDAPDHEHGVEEASLQEPPHRLPLLPQATPRKSMCSSDSGVKPTHARTQGVDLDLLVERHHRRPVANPALQVGERGRAAFWRPARGGSPCTGPPAPAGTGTQLMRVREIQSRT